MGSPKATISRDPYRSPGSAGAQGNEPERGNERRRGREGAGGAVTLPL